MADKKTSLSPAKNIFKDQRVLLAIVIALIVVIISCINPNFIGINNIVAIFQQICVLGILTMAMSILLISGGIDLSIGNIMVVCGVVRQRSAHLYRCAGWPCYRCSLWFAQRRYHCKK